MKKLWTKTKGFMRKLCERKGDLTTQYLGLMILGVLIVGVLIAFLTPAFRETILPTVTERLTGLFS